MSFTPPVERLARRLFPGQVATKLVAPEPYEHDTFTLEGHELRIIEEGRAATGLWPAMAAWRPQSFWA